MSVKLEILLSRNKISLKEFVIKNKIKSYQELLDFCKKRNFLPVSIELYNSALPAVKKEKHVSQKKKSPVRRVSSSQKKQNRDSNKKVKTAQPVSGSDVPGKNWRMAWTIYCSGIIK